MRYLFLLSLLLYSYWLGGQNPTPEQADFRIFTSGAEVKLEPILPPLQQMAGAPPAFYDHFWEFGDGTYSFAARPTHTYPDTGTYEIRLLATGKYDNGKAPRSRKRKTRVPRGGENKEQLATLDREQTILDEATAGIGLKAVRNPRPEEELALILSYTNPTPVPQSGRIYLFYNEAAFAKTHFSWGDSRTHFGEENLPDLLTQQPIADVDAWAGTSSLSNWYQVLLPAQSATDALDDLSAEYRNYHAWTFEQLMPDDARNIFVSLDATEAMLADTNAIITMTALMTTDDGRLVETFPLEMEIVASHDPNYIAVSDRRMSFRGIRSKDLTYKVHFQNTGEGPASTVEITCDVPDGLDPDALTILERYPEVPLCWDAVPGQSCLDTQYQVQELIFTFRNIYLPGTRQEGVNDRDSTKGFVKYQLDTKRSITKHTLGARASIVFDQNPPIRTNRTTTRFKAGLSPGIVGGWMMYPDQPALNHPVAGLSLSPVRPYNVYWQGEAWVGPPGGERVVPRFTQVTVSTQEEVPGLPFLATIDTITTLESEATIRTTRLGVVPLQGRYNLTGWLGIGGGAMIDLAFRKEEEAGLSTREVRYYDPNGRELREFSKKLEPTSFENTQQRTEWQATLFADLQVGSVRRGPAVSLRGYWPLQQSRPWSVAVFGTWRF